MDQPLRVSFEDLDIDDGIASASNAVRPIFEMLPNHHVCPRQPCPFDHMADHVDPRAKARGMPGPLLTVAYRWRPGDSVAGFGGVS